MKKIFSIIIIVLCSFFYLVSCINNNSNVSNNLNKEEDTNIIPSNSDSTDNMSPTKPEALDEAPPDHSADSAETLCRIYYFNSSDFKLYYVDKKITVTNNALVTALTTELQNNSYNSDFITLTKKVGIKSANLDKQKGILTVKFNESYIEYMTLGNATETGLLSAILNTYAYNYGINKVAIYFDNELYTSLKGELPEGYFTVDSSTAIPVESLGNKTAYKNCRIFYYSAKDECFYYNDEEIKIVDKAVVTNLTNALKNPPNSELLAIPSVVYVRNANLDSEKGILTVDLNSHYYDILQSVGSSGEIGALKSLAYTYGYYYGVTKIIITIEGKNYSGNHIIYEDGEYINISSFNALPCQ